MKVADFLLPTGGWDVPKLREAVLNSDLLGITIKQGSTQLKVATSFS